MTNHSQSKCRLKEQVFHLQVILITAYGTRPRNDLMRHFQRYFTFFMKDLILKGKKRTKAKIFAKFFGNKSTRSKAVKSKNNKRYQGHEYKILHKCTKMSVVVNIVSTEMHQRLSCPDNLEDYVSLDQIPTKTHKAKMKGARSPFLHEHILYPNIIKE